MSNIVYRPSGYEFFEGYPLRVSPTPARTEESVSPDERASQPFTNTPAIPFAKISIDALEEVKQDIFRGTEYSPALTIVFESNEVGDIANASFRRHDLSDTTVTVAESILKHAQVIAPYGCRLKIEPRKSADNIGNTTIPHIDEITRDGIKGIVSYPKNTLTYMGVIERKFGDIFDMTGEVRADCRERIDDLMLPTPEGEMNLLSLNSTIHAAQAYIDSIVIILAPFNSLD